MKINLYSDGACRGNPGNGGYGTILSYTMANGDLYEKEYSQGYKITTNNRMELMGVIRGLEELNKPCDVDVYTDSAYVANAFLKDWISSWEKNNWKLNTKNPVKNIDLWKRLLNASKPHNIKYHLVKGHSGHYYNEKCDKLAVNAALSGRLIEDEGRI